MAFVHGHMHRCLNTTQQIEGVVSPMAHACQQAAPAVSEHVLAKIDCM